MMWVIRNCSELAPREEARGASSQMSVDLENFVVADRHAGRSFYRLGWNKLFRVAIKVLKALNESGAMNRFGGVA